MTKTIMILVIAATFVAGMLVSAPEIYAPPPPNNPGQPFDAILQKLDQIITPSFDTIPIQFFAITFSSDADRFVLLDLHREVTEGFVVIRTNADPPCDELMVVVTDVPGTILASNTMAAIPANAVTSDADWDILCHAHIPSNPATVFVALARTPGTTPTIITDSMITTTIVSLG